MARPRLNEETASTILADIEARVSEGGGLQAACRAVGLSVPTYYRWRTALRRRQGEAPVNTAEAILSAAKTLFLRDGYGVSLESIARAAGVTRQTLYNLFGGKEYLFSAVASSIYQNLASPVMVIEREADFPTVLAAYGREFVRIALDPENIRLLRISMAGDSEIPNLTRLAYACRAAHLVPTVTDHVARYLRSQIAAGVIEPVDPLIAAEMFMGALAGNTRNRALVGAVYDTPQRLEQLLQATISLFVRGLGYRGPAQSAPLRLSA